MVWCVDSPEGVSQAADSSGLDIAYIRRFDLGRARFLSYSGHMKDAMLGPEGASFDLLHQHVIWTGVSYVTNVWRQATQRPTVMSVHGALASWCLRRSAWKKRASLLAYESKNLRTASCIHALSTGEESDIRGFGLRQPVAVIPNGLDEAWLHLPGDADAFRKAFGIPADKRVMLFLGRISPVKNVHAAVEALGKLGDRARDWVFVVAGPDEFGYSQTVKSAVDFYCLGERVVFTGPIEGQMKRDAFACAELFVLPSLTEGSPMVVLEALGANVPVLTTTGTPWSELVTQGCGWWVDSSADPLASALEEALAKSPDQLQAMGNAGKQLVLEKYTWAHASKKTIEMYEWLLGNGEKPDFVHL